MDERGCDETRDKTEETATVEISALTVIQSGGTTGETLVKRRGGTTTSQTIRKNY